jgi:drug/metabolite transporter (DMT)-like permease
VAEGAIAAVAWGLGAMTAAAAARQAGVLAAVIASQVAGGCALAVAVLAMHPGAPAPPPGAVLAAAAGGAANAVATLAYYAALGRAAPSAVSAIAATCAAVTAALAATAGGERLAAPAGGGIALAVAGVIPLAGGAAARGRHHSPRLPARPRRVQRQAGRHRGRGGGILLAGVSSAAFGVGAFLLGGAAARGGWELTTLIAYVSSVAALLAAAPAGILPRQAGPAAPRGIAWAAASGVLEAAALAALAGSGQAGHLAVASAIAGLYPAIPLAAGRLSGRERLPRSQVAGIAVIIAGIILVGVSG